MLTLRSAFQVWEQPRRPCYVCWKNDTGSRRMLPILEADPKERTLRLMVWLPTPRLAWSLWNTTELPLPNTMSLQMQSAHRSLSQKTGPDAAPMSSPVKDLTVKETSLKLAWKKEVININKIFFDHNYAYELTEKRRVYGRIKKVLEERERGVWFQTVFTGIRIHRSSSPERRKR